MKRRSKEINIFSMSALDLFASALGAFILIAIVLFPYFPNIGSSPENIAALRAQLAEARQQLQTCQEDLQAAQESLQEAQADLQAAQESLQEAQAAQESLQEAQADLQQCTEELRKKFLLVVISWGSQDDVDLHVIDPQGNEFYFAERSYPNTEAKLEEDNTRGPGNEIWLHPKATPGEYEIYYKLFSRNSLNAEVRGAILTPSGREPIPTHNMRTADEKRRVAVVTIDSDGNANLRTQ